MTSLPRRSRLTAKKGLERRTGLSRTSELKNGSQLGRRKKPARKLDRAGILNPHPSMRKLRNAVFERAGGRCDLCGHPLSERAWECHHRKKRSQGGLDEMTNLVALHSTCHHDRVHGQPDWAYRNGFLVRRDDDPAATKVFRHRSRWQVPGETQWHGADEIGDAA